MAHKGKPVMVEVEWLDACSKYEQFSLREAPSKTPLVRRFTVGFVVVRDRTRLVIAHTFDPAADEDELDGGADFTIIPRGWVESITTLVPATEQPKGEE